MEGLGQAVNATRGLLRELGQIQELGNDVVAVAIRVKLDATSAMTGDVEREEKRARKTKRDLRRLAKAGLRIEGLAKAVLGDWG